MGATVSPVTMGVWLNAAYNFQTVRGPEARTRRHGGDFNILLDVDV